MSFITSVLGPITATALLLGGGIVAPDRVGASADGSGSATEDTIEASVRYDDNATDLPGCSWAPLTGVDPVSGTLRELPATRVLEGVRWVLYERVCGTRRSLHWVREDTSRTVATRSHARVWRLIPTFLIKTAPPADKMVVNVGTWFWVPKVIWKPVRVTATIPTQAGPIIVTTTATPKLLIYSPGDGHEPAVCQGPGRPWRKIYGDAAASTCMHTYTSASHTRSTSVYNARLSVQWMVTWTSNLGVGGRLPDIRLGLGTKVRVLELQALTR